jgi:hypothetical protein
MGKGNIEIRGVAGDFIIINVRAGKKSLKCTITERAWGICFTALDLERSARRILRMPIAELWHIQK